MTDEELIASLRGKGFSFMQKAADRIEALTAELTLAEQRGYANAMEAERKLHEDLIEALTEQLEAARADAEEAEAYAEELARDLVKADNDINDRDAKLAKAVRGLNAICAWGEDTYARDMARTTLAEIEGEKG